tara:strand:+ start:675 stop:911 length:237 start_codon:yes stop_codon:yes gene_type:complete
MANPKTTPDWEIIADLNEVKTRLESIQSKFDTMTGMEQFPEGHDIYLYLEHKFEMLRGEIRQLEKGNKGYLHPDPIKT